MDAEAQLALIAILGKFVDTLPTLITSIAAALMAVVAYRSSISKAQVKQSLAEIHQLTNSNLTNEQERVERLEQLIVDLRNRLADIKE